MKACSAARFFFPVIILLVLTNGSWGQDSLARPHSPSRAAMYSAILPGWGQAYNKKYWKIPVLYAGFGTTVYFINSNSKEYNKFKDAYDYRYALDNNLSPDPSKYNDYVDKYSLNSLLDGRDYYRRNRDLSYIITAAVYILNVVDAAVDAYLFEYDISEDLSLKIEPGLVPAGISGIPCPGVHFSLDHKSKP